MTTPLTRPLWILAAAILIGSAVQAAGGSPTPAPTPTPTMTPQELAIESYNQGLKYRDKAWQVEERLAEETSDKKRVKLQAKIENEYEKAIGEFETAVANRPDFYQAHSSLGYALRKMGAYTRSVDAYEVALGLAPDYTEAIEYRAEAHLGLGRIDEAKAAYMELFSRDREKAEMLMTAMKGWAADQRSHSADGPSDQVTDLEAWIVEREEIAMQTAKLSRVDTGEGW